MPVVDFRFGQLSHKKLRKDRKKAVFSLLDCFKMPLFSKIHDVKAIDTIINKNHGNTVFTN